MRITVLCTDLGIRVPGDKEASVHLQAITGALARVGHDVQLVAVAGPEPLPAPLAAGLADSLMFEPPGRSEGQERERRKLAFVERVAQEALPRVRAFGSDVVYERLSLFGDVGARLVARLDRPVLAVEVNALLAREEAQWRGLHHARLAQARERHTLDHAAVRVAVSEETASDVAQVSPGPPTHVLANGVDVDAFATLPDRQRLRVELGLGPAERLAVFVGALRPWHGVELAIEAVALAGTTHLAVVGDGEVRGRLERLAVTLGVAHRVHFLGARAHDEIPGILAAADCAVAPYPVLADFAFSPLKVYEYLAAGVPVVASDVGQVGEALGRGRWGTLVPPGDVAALAAGILASGLPTNRRRAAAGREHALAHHGWHERAARLSRLLRDAAQQEECHAVAR